ncbi:AraC-type DNA-binding protein [Amphritea atlantica]|uniref:AraC-type DNA-binding protein n=2 Tax=Amphritea atlantica TaxID=355243 RepID=A0A1H9MG08_9GAMM|nr:AraC-type DNA-binding protein [Amphritea atlantica]
MAVVNAFSYDTFLKQDALFALGTVLQKERRNPPQAPHYIMKKSLGMIQVCVGSYDQFVDISEPDSPGWFQLIIVQQGGARLWLKSDELSLGCGDLCLVNTSENLNTAVDAGSQIVTIRMPVETLTEDAVHLGYHLRASGLVFKPNVFKLEQLGVLKHQILSLLDAEPGQTPEQLKVQYRHFFSCLLLQRFENNADPFYKVSYCENPKIEKIRRWVISDPRKEYKPLDLAAYINVSERSLYHLFKNEFGLSPRVYICHIKLECIYRELVDLKSMKNITQVALEYGFNNLGRFAKVYRDYFGESPSQTCRR